MPGLYRWAVNDHKSQRFFVPHYALSIRVPCEQSVHYHNLENRPHFTDDPRGKGMALGAQLKHGGAESQKKDVCFQSPELQTLHSAGGFLRLIARSRSGQVWKKRMTV